MKKRRRKEYNWENVEYAKMIMAQIMKVHPRNEKKKSVINEVLNLHEDKWGKTMMRWKVSEKKKLIDMRVK